ncbi:MAG: hypothetical protein GXO70_05480 [Acidobacteria bacterium]|nr:hypothetical protein [Acidobacteriota bacterium]
MPDKTKLKILIFSIVAVNIGLLAFVGYRQSAQRKAFLSLRSEDAFLFLEGLSHNLETASRTQAQLKKQLTVQLEISASVVMEQLKQICSNPGIATSAMKRFQLWKLVVLDSKGRLVWSSRGGFGRQADPEVLKVCRGLLPQYVIGLRENYRKTGYRFGLVRHLPQGGALVLIMDGNALHRIFEKTTFTHVLTHVSGYEGLEFVRFEDMEKVLYDSSGKESGVSLSKVRNDSEIMEAVYTNSPFVRTISLKGNEVLEAVWPVYVDNVFQGVIRVGLSLDYVQLLDSTTLWLTLITLGMIGVLDLLFVIAWHRNRRLNREARKYQAILERIQDGVLIRHNDGSWTGNASVGKLLGENPCVVICDAPVGLSRLNRGHRVFLVLRNPVDDTDIFIIRDVTLEDAAEESRAREERLFSTGKLASAFAHEIRNPLNTISMIFQQVKNAASMGKTEKDLLRVAEEEVRRLNDFIEKFMRVSKDPEIHPEVAALSPLLLQLAELYRPRMESANVKLNVKIDKLITLSYDRDRLKGVFVNLLENSLDADASSIEIRGTKTGRFAEISLQDDGCGMEPEQVERVFDLYYTTKQKGTGLGLAYVQRIVSAHGGFVRVESEPGIGTRFSILLPLEGES